MNRRIQTKIGTEIQSVVRIDIFELRLREKLVLCVTKAIRIPDNGTVSLSES